MLELVPIATGIHRGILIQLCREVARTPGEFLFGFVREGKEEVEDRITERSRRDLEFTQNIKKSQQV